MSVSFLRGKMRIQELSFCNCLMVKKMQAIVLMILKCINYKMKHNVAIRHKIRWCHTSPIHGIFTLEYESINFCSLLKGLMILKQKFYTLWLYNEFIHLSLAALILRLPKNSYSAVRYCSSAKPWSLVLQNPRSSHCLVWSWKMVN